MKADLEIIREVLNGNKSAFATLVERHQNSMLRLAWKVMKDLDLAEDVVQDSFVKAFKKLNTFEGRATFKSWLYQITLNTARNRLRAKKRETIGVEHIEITSDESPEKEANLHDVRDFVREEVNLLPEKQRIALSLRIYEDMSFKEIAKVMQCPYDTAKANYRHALLKLKSKIVANESIGFWDDHWIGAQNHMGAFSEVKS